MLLTVGFLLAVKHKALKLKQDARVGHACFVKFDRGNAIDLKFPSIPASSLKATYIQALSPETFMVLDSHGDLHLLCLPKSKLSSSSKFDVHLKRLPHIMKVQHLAALPDSTMSMQLSSVHVLIGFSIFIHPLCALME